MFQFGALWFCIYVWNLPYYIKSYVSKWIFYQTWDCYNMVWNLSSLPHWFKMGNFQWKLFLMIDCQCTWFLHATRLLSKIFSKTSKNFNIPKAWFKETCRFEKLLIDILSDNSRPPIKNMYKILIGLEIPFLKKYICHKIS